MNGLANARIGAASANVAGHGFVDVFVGRGRVLGQQNCRAHDLTGLTIAALGNVNFDPGLLQGMTQVGSESFNRRDLFAGSISNSLYTRANRFSVEMYRTRAAEGHAAAVFGSGQSQRFPEHPEERRVRIDVDVELFAVNFEINHGRTVNRNS